MNQFYGIAAGLATAYLIKKKVDSMGRVVTGWSNGVPLQIAVVQIDQKGHLLEQHAAIAYAQMFGAAMADGVILSVNSAWRDHDDQAALYAQYQAGTGNLAAPPGYSNHESGLAIDVESAGGTNEAFNWLTANAYRFNFVRTVSTEPWHWEYKP